MSTAPVPAYIGSSYILVPEKDGEETIMLRSNGINYYLLSTLHPSNVVWFVGLNIIEVDRGVDKGKTIIYVPSYVGTYQH